MKMLILLTVLLGLSSLVDATAIKGHAPARPLEEVGRSIKLAAPAPIVAAPAPVVAEKANVKASAAPAPVVPSVPILESSKKVYNDESIRRLVAQQPVAPVEQVKQAPVEPVVQREAPVVPVVPPQAAPVVPPVVVKSTEPAVAAPAAQAPVAEQQAPVVAPVVEKQAPVVVPAVVPQSAPVDQQPAVKPVDELPQQSDRSAPIRNEVPVVSPVVVEQVVPAKSFEQPAVVPIAAQPQPEAVAPVVVPAVQPEPVVVMKESQLQGKKDEAPVVPANEPFHIEVPAPDPGLVLSEPIDSTTKLLIDLDEHVQKFLPAEDQQQPQAPKDQNLVAGVDYSPAAPVVADPTGKSSGPLIPYAGADEPIVPPLPALNEVEKASAPQATAAQAPAAASSPASPTSQSGSSSVASPSATRQAGQHQNQQQVITQLLDQLDSLQNRIQDTINQLVARRRYVMSALLRPMGTYVRRVRTNLERLQNRVNQLQAAAVSVGGGNTRPGGFVDAAAIETIRRRIDDISKRTSDIVNRIRFSLTPTSAPMNSNGRK